MALLASIYLERRVIRPLQTLRLGVERIGKGDLDFRLDIKTGDEIENLAEEFNKMTWRPPGGLYGLGAKSRGEDPGTQRDSGASNSDRRDVAGNG